MYLVMAHFANDDAPIALFERIDQAHEYCRDITANEIHATSAAVYAEELSFLESLSIVRFDGPRPKPCLVVREFDPFMVPNGGGEDH